MKQTYVSKRFRTFRRPIIRKFANGGVIQGGCAYKVGTGDRELVIPIGQTMATTTIYSTVTLRA